MHTTYHNNARGGHCPGHIRETFLQALDAYLERDGCAPEPTVELEVGYNPRPIAISKAAGLVWSCSDILPGDAVTAIEGSDLRDRVRRYTYAGAARAMRSSMATPD